MKNIKKILAVVMLALFTAFTLSAQELPTGLTLPSVVSDNMVLQQNALVNIWGWAKPKAKVAVTVDWNATKLATKADKEGYWCVQVQTPAASFDSHTVTIVAGKESRTLGNILIGEVWLCAGQSNMEFKVRQTLDMKHLLEGEMNPYIRTYCTGRISAETPQNDVPEHDLGKGNRNTKWCECNPTDLAEFSAVGYGFGAELQEQLGVPVGLIDASYGGTFIEGWMKKEVIDADGKLVADCGKIKHKVWKGKESHLYNANIYPIRHTSIAGVIWYQGCANVSSSPRGYAHALEVLVNSWREEFRNPEMPFYLVEIVPHTYAGIKGAQLRESQMKAATKMDHCEIVCTNDQLEIPGDIHPRLKATIAHRLAQCALGEHYGVKVGEFRSPAYESMSVEGDKIRVRFKNVPTTLVAKDGAPLGFQIAEKDPQNEKRLKFVLASAEIVNGNEVLVSAPGVSAPVAVRYCFNEAVGNMFSAEGLPLAAFRTDKSNASQSARPYVETPSQMEITFEGKGYTRSTFTKGAHMWPNLKQVLSDVYPMEYDGFEMLTAPCVKKVKTPGGKITASEDGYVYCLVRASKDMLKVLWKTEWELVLPAYSRAITPEGKLISNQYVARHPVKAGDVVKLPVVKDHYSVFVLGKKINYVEVAE